MKYRNTVVLAEKTMSTTGTEIIPINVKDIISRINIMWQVDMITNGMDSWPYSDITKIELVDGSDVLHSLDGAENQALCIYDRKCPTMNGEVWLNENKGISTYGIDFGRFLHDPELAFDPTKFTNPQLKISYDVDVMCNSAEAAYLSVWADCFDEKVISPIGFLMSKEVWSAVKPTSGYEAIILPTDYPYRKMLLKVFASGYEPYSLVDEVRLDEDNQKRIPFDFDLEDYYYLMKGSWTPVVDMICGIMGRLGGYPFYVTPSVHWNNPSGMPIAETYMYVGGGEKGGIFTPMSPENEAFFFAQVHGYLPNHCVEFPFGNPMDIDDWYDVSKVGSLRLRLHAGDSDVTDCGIVVQQLRRY